MDPRIRCRTEEAKGMRVSSTPTFVVGGRRRGSHGDGRVAAASLPFLAFPLLCSALSYRFTPAGSSQSATQTLFLFFPILCSQKKKNQLVN
jgi:hypothetical protein